MKRAVRIGNAQAFWGDRSDAAAELLAREPDLDFLTMDYLAEVSMSILATQRERDSRTGFARDFVEVVRSIAPYWTAGGRCRLIVNAGGLNPLACGEACCKALEKAGCRSMQIGIVSGDDVLPQLKSASISNEWEIGNKSLLSERAETVLGESGASTQSKEDFSNLDTQAKLSEIGDRLVTANAYLGATPILEALAAGAEIVITGRVADPSLVVAACMHHFGWRETDLHRLAGATVAGHLIECGTQVTGGISTDWLDVPDPVHIGFPIVEVADDGSCMITKSRGTGGRVTAMTVKEQLVYEIGDPANYISPDVTVSFLTVQVDDLGADQVRVWGASGAARPEKLKVSATYTDGFRAAGSLTFVGRDVVEKATRCGHYVIQRVREAGFELRDCVVECLGSGACWSGIVTPQNLCETVLRVAVESPTREACERFSRELMPFVTAGPQGTTGYAEGRPRVHPVVRFWPCLIDRKAVTPVVELLFSGEGNNDKFDAPTGMLERRPSSLTQSPGPASTEEPQPSNRLYDIACARSGDKGLNANIGVISRKSDSWEMLRSWLTQERVAEFLSPLGFQSIDRFELPNLQALNFVLHDVLNSLHTDAQGKSLGQILLEMPLPPAEHAYNETSASSDIVSRGKEPATS